MNPSEIAEEIISTLRDVLEGSDREISISCPLGELGLGLDSLSMVTFVTALENKYDVQFPDDIWINRGRLTIQDFVDLLSDSGIGKKVSLPTEQKVVFERSQTKLEKVVKAINELGWSRGLIWSAWQFVSSIRRATYRHSKKYILAFDLKNENIPDYHADLNIDLRVAGIDDLDTLSKIEVVQQDKTMNAGLYGSRLESGFLCLVAYHDGRIVGVDWISDRGNEEYDTIGLSFEMKERSCYALELYEDKAFVGKGIGMALLSFSLQVCKEKGYERQITWVNANNVKMLSSSIQLFGFKKIGEIEVRRIFNRPYSKWTIENEQGKGKVIRI